MTHNNLIKSQISSHWPTKTFPELPNASNQTLTTTKHMKQSADSIDKGNNDKTFNVGGYNERKSLTARKKVTHY